MKFTFEFWTFLLYSVIVNAQFNNVTNELNLTHHHLSPTLIGGGIAFIDVNNDGWEDIYMTGGSLDDRLYINNQGKSFEDQSPTYLAPYIRSGSQNSGVAVGDFDNDGWDDLFITTLSDKEANYLLKNSGTGFFIDVSRAAGITEQGPSTGAALVDINQDGYLDIYVINYVEEVVFITDSANLVVGFDHVCATNTLYINNGDFSFTEATEDYGVAGEGCGLAVTGSEFLNQETGVYIANDYGEWIKENELFIADNSDTVVSSSKQYGLDIALYGMGIAIGDYDQDLDFDLYISNLGANAFMINQQGQYTNLANQYGIENEYVIEDSLLSTGWGTLFFDYDNDTYLDLFVANGYIPSSRFIPTFFLDPNKLYKNLGNRFVDVSESLKMDFLGVSRGVITGDYDLDGDLDMIVSTVVGGEPDEDDIQKSQFYQNENIQGNFLDIKLVGTTSNRNGYGSIIRIVTEAKEYIQLQYSGGTHASQNSQVVHFGLGERTLIDTIVVSWPSGHTDRYNNVAANQKIQIIERADQIEVLGCMDIEAKNYNSLATINSGCEDRTTAVTDLSTIEQALIVPNPASDYFELKTSAIEFRIARILVYNNLGTMVKSFSYDNTIKYKIDDLTSGVYFVIIEGSNNQHQIIDRLIISE